MLAFFAHKLRSSLFTGRQPLRYTYERLPGGGERLVPERARGEGEGEGEERWSVWDRSKRLFLKVTLFAMSTVIVLYLVVVFGHIARSAPTGPGPQPPAEGEKCDTPEVGFQCNRSVSHFWGQYSPFFSVPSEIDPALPAGCELTFAQVLSRHGGRDPTLGKTLQYGALVARIHESVAPSEYGKGLGFLRDYAYRLGADQLTAFGQQQMVNSGVAFYRRYRALARAAGDEAALPPFVRSAGQERVVVSALNWTQGFHAALVADQGKSGGGDGTFPYDVLILPETRGFNNTLSNDLCRAFSSSPGSAAQRTFAATFAPAIAERLNAGLPGANLSTAEAIDMMDLCAFETVADPGGRLSPFCELFSEDEWRSYDYFQSLGKWYGYGDGNPLGATRGVGFAAELIARLTGEPVRDHTCTNATLDDDPRTFPPAATGAGAGGQRLFADFSHDNDMAGMFAALGLYNGTGAPPPPATRRVPARDMGGYSASWTVPFGARMYVEKMVCPGGATVEGEEEGEELVRVLVNDRVVPLQRCGADALGRCTLSRFVESLGFVRSGGDWDKCFE